MKILFALTYVAISIAAFSQKPLPEIEGKVVYTEVVNVDSASAGVLYQRAKLFFAKMYNSSKDVVQVDDKENGLIVGKGFFSLTFEGVISSWQAEVDHTISVRVKEGKYKYEFTDLYIRQPKDALWPSGPIEFYNTDKRVHKKFDRSVDAKMKAIINELRSAMVKVEKDF